VFLGEPSRTAYDLNFTLFRIPVRVHPLFWVAGLLLGQHSASGQQLLFWLVAFFLGILGHELGHALVMRFFGSFSWITLYGFGGLASCDRSYAIGDRRKQALRHIAVSAAGPLAGFLMAVLVIAVAKAVKGAACGVYWDFGLPYGLNVIVFDRLSLFADQPQPLWAQFANKLLFVTVVYGILNLLPVYPLDGGQIMRQICLLLFGSSGIRTSLGISMVVAVTIAMYGGVKLHDPFLAIFFGAFAFASFASLQSHDDNRPWS
jgi:stage IV sporulation protein FB